MGQDRCLCRKGEGWFLDSFLGRIGARKPTAFGDQVDLRGFVFACTHQIPNSNSIRTASQIESENSIKNAWGSEFVCKMPILTHRSNPSRVQQIIMKKKLGGVQG